MKGEHKQAGHEIGQARRIKIVNCELNLNFSFGVFHIIADTSCVMVITNQDVVNELKKICKQDKIQPNFESFVTSTSNKFFYFCHMNLCSGIKFVECLT